MEEIILCIHEFSKLNTKNIIYMNNHDYPRLTYNIENYYTNLKKLMKLLHRQNVIHTYVQKEHIINLIQKLIKEANIVIKYLENHKMENVYQLLEFCILNLKSINKDLN
jgi:hypothetical protein